ncbi:MAG: hypothetical protein HY611_02455 [Elusimicrobia bacterium]|nr:hypothetical protein [Elusimicrobiota bacterium]
MTAWKKFRRGTIFAVFLAASALALVPAASGAESEEEILSACRKSLDSGLKNPSLYHQCAQIYRRRRDISTAFAYIRRALRYDPKRPKYHFENAEIYWTLTLPEYAADKAFVKRVMLRLKRSYYADKCVANFDKAIELSFPETCLVCHFRKGEVLLAEEEIDRAILEFNFILSREPDDFAALKLRGDAYMQFLDQRKAWLDYRKACDGGNESACRAIEAMKSTSGVLFK